MESYEKQIQAWNQQIAQRYIVNDVFLVLYIVIGILGNLLVIIVYKFKIKVNDDRYFIPWLAVLDLFAGTLRSSFELIRKLYPVMLHGTVYCKTVWMIIDVFAFSSTIMLLVIAFHRYLKVCRPMGSQMTLPWKRRVLFVTFFTSTVAAVILNSFNAEIPVQNEILNITGSTCDIDVDGALGRLSFFVFIGAATAMTLLILVGLLVFYLLIARTICRQMRMRHAMKYATTRASISECRCGQCVKLSISHRFSFMLMSIAAGFGISYIPQFVILFWTIRNGAFLFSKYDTQTIVVSFFRELVIVNHLINPFLYGFYDTLFRKQVKKLMSVCFRRTCSRFYGSK